jgi:hypothetical protein
MENLSIQIWYFYRNLTYFAANWYILCAFEYIFYCFGMLQKGKSGKFGPVGGAAV